jgi:2-aminoadipate transaminase
VAAISFARGIPSPDLLPVSELGECARAVVERDGATVLNYGPPGGYGPLRQWIAGRHGVRPERVLVTNGSLQGFNLVARHVFGGGGRAVVEAPTYDRTLKVLAAVGAGIEAVNVTDEGLDVDGLARTLGAREAPGLLYTIPTFQNPTGHTLSLERRRALVALARERDVLVYEDDPYGGVRFEGEHLPTLHELARGERVIYSSSFSKTVAPGIRVGYLILPEELVEPIEALALESYLSPTMLVQGALHEFLTQGYLEPNLERVRRELRARRDAIIGALERELGLVARWNEPKGGYFLWLEVPGADAAALLARAADAGVAFVKGADFYAGPGGEDAARLAFSFASRDEIVDGVSRLGRLVREAAPVAV